MPTTTFELRDGRAVVVKTADSGEDEALCSEADRLELLHDSGVVSLVDAVPSPTGLAELITELVPGPTLATVDPMTIAERDQLIDELTAVLGRLHDRGLAHGELTPEHVIVGPAGPVVCSLRERAGATAASDLEHLAALAATIPTTAAESERRLPRRPDTPRLRSDEGPRRLRSRPVLAAAMAVAVASVGLVGAALLRPGGSDASALPPRGGVEEASSGRLITSTAPEPEATDPGGDEDDEPSLPPPEPTLATPDPRSPTPTLPIVPAVDPLPVCEDVDRTVASIAYLDLGSSGCLRPAVVDEGGDLRVGDIRLSVGRGGEWLIGSWWCGDPVAAVHVDGWLHLFDRWPSDDGPVTAAVVVPAAGEILGLRRDVDGCDRIVLDPTDGPVIELDARDLA